MQFSVSETASATFDQSHRKASESSYVLFCWVLLNTSFSLNVIHWHTWKYKILTLCVVDNIRHFYFSFSKNLLLNKVTVYVSSPDKGFILLLSYRLETHGLFLLFCLLVHNKCKHRHAPPPRSACVPGLATPTGEEKSGSRWDPGGVGSCTQCEAHGLVASTVPLLNLLMSLSSQPLLQQAIASGTSLLSRYTRKRRYSMICISCSVKVFCKYTFWLWLLDV